MNLFFSSSTGVWTQGSVDARQTNTLLLSYITGTILYFRHRVLLHYPGWALTLHVIQAGLKLVVLLPQYLRSHKCTTRSSKSSFFHTMNWTALDRVPGVISTCRPALASDPWIWVYSFSTGLEWSHISSLLPLPKASEHHFPLGHSLPRLLCSLQVSVIPVV